MEGVSDVSKSEGKTWYPSAGKNGIKAAVRSSGKSGGLSVGSGPGNEQMGDEARTLFAALEVPTKGLSVETLMSETFLEEEDPDALQESSLENGRP